MSSRELPQPDDWDHPIAGSQPKHQTIAHHLHQFAQDMRLAADAADALLRDPGPDRAHAALEAVRITAQARDEATTACEHLAFTANQAPDQVSIPKLAAMMRVSINTLRRRLPRIRQGSPSEPFTEF